MEKQKEGGKENGKGREEKELEKFKGGRKGTVN